MYHSDEDDLFIGAQLEGDRLGGSVEDGAGVDQHYEVAIELLCDLDDGGDNEGFEGRLVLYWGVLDKLVSIFNVRRT